MPWHDAGVPGRGWIELRSAVRRIRTSHCLLSCDCLVRTDTDAARLYQSSGENFQKLQDAIRRGRPSVRLIRGANRRAGPLLVRIEAAGSGPEGWLNFWSREIGIEVLRVYRWDARRTQDK